MTVFLKEAEHYNVQNFNLKLQCNDKSMNIKIVML